MILSENAQIDSTSQHAGKVIAHEGGKAASLVLRCRSFGWGDGRFAAPQQTLRQPLLSSTFLVCPPCWRPSWWPCRWRRWCPGTFCYLWHAHFPLVARSGCQWCVSVSVGSASGEVIRSSRSRWQRHAADWRHCTLVERCPWKFLKNFQPIIIIKTLSPEKDNYLRMKNWK